MHSKLLALCLIVSSTSNVVVHGSVTVKKNQRGSEQDDETISFHLPQHRVVVTNPNTNSNTNMKVQKFTIKIPNQLSVLPERVATLQKNQNLATDLDDIPPTSITTRKAKSSKTATTTTTTTTNIPEISPLLNSGLALMALSSFVFTKQGMKALKELATGALSALALVWVPTLLVHGGWVELAGAITLVTLPNTRRFIHRECVPKAFGTLKRLFLSEVWRRIWVIVLAPLPKPLLVPSDHDIMRIHWLPEWLKQGFLYFRDKVDNFVLSTFKGSVQKSVYGTMGVVYDSVASSSLEISMIYEDSATTEESVSSMNDNDNDNDNDTDDESDDHTPQLVCDGDTCRWE